ncbi:Adenine nucleotide alpha hydrolase-like domain kinase [Heracleum sosnowskyi]|uniref:Adenine nucleotide alpha hydrolase-like domain kinase n=1 Tax=Heracleum sosnowskyi TaxID=360622 RepID=A0AAD8GYD3_9APIA|nr:Adenine nucleotide alpha hydrolase-like domain kinase [Heracleum sosnowskyi]
MSSEVILVAVDASKEVTDYTLDWAVQNVIKPKDSLILLPILPSSSSPSRVVAKTNSSPTLYQFITGVLKKRSNHRENAKNLKEKIAEDNCGDQLVQNTHNSCTQMIRQLLKLHSIVQVRTEVKVVADLAPEGSITKVAQELGATWVILDRCLKKEDHSSLKQLNNCNLILIDREIQRALKPVNMYKEDKLQEETEFLQDKPTVADMLGMFLSDGSTTSQSTSPSLKANTFSSSSSSSPIIYDEEFYQIRKPDIFSPLGQQYVGHRVELESTYRSSNRYSKSQPLSNGVLRDLEVPAKSKSGNLEEKGSLSKSRSDINWNIGIKTLQPTQVMPRISIDIRLSRPKPPISRQENTRRETNQTNGVAKIDRLSSIRKAMSVSIKQPPIPPPLCSVCKNNAPIFGWAPRKFTYMEIQEATDGFSKNNFLAKGGFGHVYKGVLDDGQVVAVKQHKVLSAQGASEFCSEVEVLSCAQHKNLVILVGYCIEVEWLLVYEFACHGSLDKHLYGRGEPMAWQNRMKVAIGAARGLRYLHEDCRVGCIVHRDFRPNNILLTHDFESMVGDFGLARWQADGQSAEETRIVGAFGYLAPEYTQTGLITEKADVYAFGVVLLELLTGIKATEFARNAKQSFMPDWSRQFLESKVSSEIVDPRLDHNFVEKEVNCMIQAANLCISPHPDQRPRMSEVLKILEGYMPRVVPSSHLQSASTFPRHNLIEDCTDNKPEDEKIQRNRLMYAGIHDNKQNPLHQSVKKDTQLQSIYNKHMTVTDETTIGGTANKMVKNTSKLPRNENYQEYLQGSLSRYIQNMKVM